MANWASVQRLGNPIDPGWQQQNLTWIEPVPGQKWQVYKPAAAAFEGLLKDLAAGGYPLKSSGGFNYRNIRGGNNLSQHAFGTAIDVNASANPFLSRGAQVVTDLPANTAELAKKYGLEWGGTWSRPDAMHFEWMGNGQPQTMVASATPAPAGKSIASMFTPSQGTPVQPGGVSAAYAPQGAAPALGSLALMFAQQQADRQRQREDEQQAEQMRKAALFSADSLASLYG
ncbi:M15 family metallopeptidase [Rhizobium phaseoli]|uniref:M15 family metallopeptidase n=1 Tax=Rhizobium phaseoli TaxID=396 RepID=UPI002552F2AD|nr:M15 family metallopeptidase [Rhizobium phaseoli]MDK4729332.1 M15 family metallopeptidase [Rhizobium phaseoli]